MMDNKDYNRIKVALVEQKKNIPSTKDSMTRNARLYCSTL